MLIRNHHIVFGLFGAKTYSIAYILVSTKKLVGEVLRSQVLNFPGGVALKSDSAD